MNLREKYIEELINKLPDLLTPKDLVSCGIYKTHQAAYQARVKGSSPPYFRISYRGIVYPKSGIVDYLKTNYIGSL